MIRGRYELQEFDGEQWRPRARYTFRHTATRVLEHIKPHAPRPLRVWDIEKGEPIA